MMKVVGYCSLCGGKVVVPEVQMSVIPMTPECFNCGAVALGGSVVDTTPVKRGNVKWTIEDVSGKIIGVGGEGSHAK